MVNTNEIRAVVPVDFKRVGLTVAIVTPERTMYLQGASQEDTYAWIHDINRIQLQSREPDALPELSQQMGTLHLRMDARRGSMRTDNAGMARAEPAAPLKIAPRSSTAPAVSISKVCHDMLAEPGVLSTSPTSVAVEARDAPELDGIRNEARLMPPASQPVLSSSEEEGEVDDGQAAVRPPPRPIPPEDLNRIIAQGYLMKQSSRRKQWRKRWFVLTVHMMYYARSHMDIRTHRSIPTSMILDVMECEPPQGTSPPFILRSLAATPLPTDSAHAKHPFNAEASVQNVLRSPSRSRLDRCFKIVTPRRTYFVCAPTEEDEIKWLSALQTILNRKRSAPMPEQRTTMNAN